MNLCKLYPQGTQKKDGNINIYILFIFILFFMVLIIYFSVQRQLLPTAMLKLKTAVDFSNLATYKNISKQQLGTTNEITFDEADLNSSISTFKEYLQDNLELDSNLAPKNNNIIIEPMSIEKLIIYSKKDNFINEYVYTKNSSGFKKNYVYDLTKENSKTPTGKEVTKTAIFVQVGFKIKTVFNEDYSNVITSYTDILNN